LLLQIPDTVLAGIVLWLLHTWADLPGAWVAGLFGVWVVKDVAMYPLLRDAFAPSRTTGPEMLVGAQGIVVAPLAPGGYVRVGGELWAAECAPPRNGEVPAGCPIVVRAARGLTLLVETLECTPP
jgi:membrane protein implicated in regulation of membrane protease activity